MTAAYRWRAIAVLNRDGGTLRTADLDALAGHIRKTFEAAGHAVETRIVSGRSLLTELDRAARDGEAEVLIAGGGDGTVSAAASACWTHGHALGVLPAGTMNFYARTLGVPLVLEKAVTALAAGSLAKADIATANGRPFIHQFSVGMQSRMIREREKLEYNSRAGKILSNIRAMVSSLIRPPSFPVRLDDGNAPYSGRRSLVAVSNNRHGTGHLPWPDTYNAGELGIYQVPSISAADAVRLVADMAIGSWETNPQLSVSSARKLSLHFPRLKHNVHASVDGELIDLEQDIAFEIHPGELKVLLPGIA